MATSKEVLDAAARVSAYILKLEATIAEDADTIIKLTKRYVEQQAENKALREALRDAQEGFDIASAGGGVDFYAYAAEIKVLLEEKIND